MRANDKKKHKKKRNKSNGKSEARKLHINSSGSYKKCLLRERLKKTQEKEGRRKKTEQGKARHGKAKRGAARRGEVDVAKTAAMKTQINIFANLLLSEKYCANKSNRGANVNVCKIFNSECVCVWEGVGWMCVLACEPLIPQRLHVTRFACGFCAFCQAKRAGQKRWGVCVCVCKRSRRCE